MALAVLVQWFWGPENRECLPKIKYLNKYVDIKQRSKLNPDSFSLVSSSRLLHILMDCTSLTEYPSSHSEHSPAHQIFAREDLTDTWPGQPQPLPHSWTTTQSKSVRLSQDGYQIRWWISNHLVLIWQLLCKQNAAETNMSLPPLQPMLYFSFTVNTGAQMISWRQKCYHRRVCALWKALTRALAFFPPTFHAG